jgi:uncharacterized phage protein gp47/JayE
MSLQTPTTDDVYLLIIADLEAALNQTIPLLPKSFLRVLAKTLAGVFITLYKYGGFTFLQIFPQTASFEDTVVNGVVINPLKSWGELVGIGDPTAATNAELLIDITVENQVGTLPTGSQLVGATNGVTYITLGSVLLDAPTVQVTVKAVEDQQGNGGAGTIGNLDPGAVISFANPLANVARDAAVNSQVVTGANEEAEAVYRQRIIDRFQKPPQGGAYSDYEIWAEEVAGIINAYPYTSGSCPGQVDVYSEATVASSGSADGIPTLAQLQAVLDSIELNQAGLASRRPAGALPLSLAISRTGFDAQVIGITDVSNVATVEGNVQTAIEEYFLNAEPYIPGLSVPPRRDKLTDANLTAVAADVVAAAGGTFTGVEFYLTGSLVPLSLYALSEGEKAKASNVSFS